MEYLSLVYWRAWAWSFLVHLMQEAFWQRVDLQHLMQINEKITFKFWVKIDILSDKLTLSSCVYLPNFGWEGDKEFKTAVWLGNEVLAPRELPLVFNPFLVFPCSPLMAGRAEDDEDVVVWLFWLWILLEWCDADDALLTADGVGLGLRFRS